MRFSDRAMLLILALLVALPLSAATGDAEFAKLGNDIRAVATEQLRNPLLAKLSSAMDAAARGQSCTAINVLGALSNQIAAKTSKSAPTDGKPLSPLAGGLLQTGVTGAVAALLGTPSAASCGGSPSTPSQETAPVVTVVSSTVDGMQLRVNFPQARFTMRSGNGRPFTDVAMDGVGDGSAVGEPHVPRMTRFFAIPRGADVSVAVLGSSSFTLSNVDLWPLQEEAVDQVSEVPPETFPDPSVFADKPFQINEKLYSVNAMYPQSPTGARDLGMLRDLRLGGVELNGAQYNPASRLLRVYTSLDLKLTFGGRNQKFFADNRTCDPYNVTFGRLYGTTVLNVNIVCGLLEYVRWKFCGEEVLIITSPLLRPAADTLATARRAAGYLVRVVETGSGSGQAGTTNEQIQTYIRGRLNSHCRVRPSYLILFGDTANVPTFLVPCSPGAPTGCLASDLPYALNGIGTDLFADIAYGRIPAPDLATANTVVNKTITYETTAPALPGAGFYNHGTITSFFQGDGPQDARGFTRTTETIRTAIQTLGYTIDRLYYASPSADIQTYYTGEAIPAELKRPTFAWDSDTTDMIAAINGGRFIFFHRDHGWWGGWGHPDLSIAEIPALTNGNALPVIFGIDCSSARFDMPGTPSFVERMIQSPIGGAVGGFGDTRDSPTWANNHMALGFFDAIFPPVVPTYGLSTPVKRMGDVLLAGKQYMATQDGLDGQSAGNTYQEHYLYHYLGDPTMQLWSKSPRRFDLGDFVFEFEQVIEPLPGDPPYRIVLDSLRDPSHYEGTIATLLRGGEVVGRGIIRGGRVVISPDVFDGEGGFTVALEQDGFHSAIVDVRYPDIIR